ncbi:MAG: hemolysin III family protein [Pseudomonadota bacterium]
MNIRANATLANSIYTESEERLHVATHGIGVVLALVGLGWMLTLSIGAGDPWRIVASAIYGTTLILVFLASTVYHLFSQTRFKALLKLLDHCAIYLFIAGTYTPFLLVSLRGATGWWLFAIIWSLAVAGVVMKLWFRHRFPRLALASYVAMGWLVVAAGPAVANAVGPQGVAWLLAGGVVYTVGALIYAAKKIAYHHAAWHAFVLIGGVCHFNAVALYVLPIA